MTRPLVRESLHFERAVSPLFATVLVPAIERGYNAASDLAGGGPGTLELRVLDGWVHGAHHPREARPPPEDAPDLGTLADRWAKERVPEVRRALDDVRAAARPGVPPRRAAAELARAEREAERLLALHYECAFASQGGAGMLEGFLARVGDPAPHLTVATLLAPCPSLLREADEALARARTLDDLRRSPAWADLCDRPAWLDLAAPTWGESPERAARALAAASPEAFDEGTRRALARRAEAEAATVARFPPGMREQVPFVVDMVRRARSVSQSTNFLVGEVLVGALRGAYLRAAALLPLAEPADVFLLTRDELHAALLGDALPRLDDRRVERPPPPATSGGPELLGGAPARALGASPGVATGRARVVTRDEDLDALEAGEVLVVRALLPAWTSAMQRACAVVAEAGGMLSHAAIVAREMGRPAVVGLAEATTRFRTGEKVTVDGDRGTAAAAP